LKRLPKIFFSKILITKFSTKAIAIPTINGESIDNIFFPPLIISLKLKIA
jgi:hypothetical protein